MNAHRQNSIARMLSRHSHIVTEGYHGCLCGKVKLNSRLSHTRHLAELVDSLVEEALDAAFGNHERYRNNPQEAS